MFFNFISTNCKRIFSNSQFVKNRLIPINRIQQIDLGYDQYRKLHTIKFFCDKELLINISYNDEQVAKDTYNNVLNKINNKETIITL
jgi:hypothetical protein